MPEPQSTPDAIVTIEPSLAGIAREEWDACANPGWQLTPDGAVPAAGGGAAPEHPFNPFVAHDFLWSLEEAGTATPRTGWAGPPAGCPAPPAREQEA